MPEVCQRAPRYVVPRAAKGLGHDYDGYRRGHCTGCQVEHHQGLLAGTLGLLLTGKLREEIEGRCEILVDYLNVLLAEAAAAPPPTFPIHRG